MLVRLGIGTFLAVVVLFAFVSWRSRGGETRVDLLENGRLVGTLRVGPAVEAASNRVGFEITLPCQAPAGYRLSAIDSLIPPEKDSLIPRALLVYEHKADATSVIAIALAQSPLTIRPAWAQSEQTPSGAMLWWVPDEPSVLRPGNYFWLDAQDDYRFVTAAGPIRPSTDEMRLYLKEAWNC